MVQKNYDGALDDAVSIAQALIRCQSVTPKDDGALDIVSAHLSRLGFDCQRLAFENIDNLYARIGRDKPFLCFAGHTDVVPIGDLAQWDYPPFDAQIIDNRLYGRGVSDMKGAIAAFMAACALYLKKHGSPRKGSLGLLITGDEEAEALYGTKEVLAHITQKGEVIDDCLVGEPSNPERLGEAIKIGRRGSLNIDLEVYGQQGHAANPHLARNPLPFMGKILAALADITLDKGMEHFIPSNLEITSIDTGNEVRNVIPASCRAQMNIRYNPLHTASSLEAKLRKIIDGFCLSEDKIDYQLTTASNGMPFLTKPCAFSDLVREIVHQKTGMMPEMATNGGTSDARYIKDYASVVEFGLTTQTIHKVNEWAFIDDIVRLTDIYYHIIHAYFEQSA